MRERGSWWVRRKRRWAEEEEGEQEGMEWREKRKWLGSRRLEGGEESLDRVEAE